MSAPRTRVELLAVRFDDAPCEHEDMLGHCGECCRDVAGDALNELAKAEAQIDELRKNQKLLSAAVYAPGGAA